MSFRILNEEAVGDSATVAYEANFADGRTVQNSMRYVRVGNEWRQALDFDAPATGKLSQALEVPAGRAGQ